MIVTNSTSSDSNINITNIQRGSLPLNYHSPISGKFNSNPRGLHEKSIELVRNISFNEIDN